MRQLKLSSFTPSTVCVNGACFYDCPSSDALSTDEKVVLVGRPGTSNYFLLPRNDYIYKAKVVRMELFTMFVVFAQALRMKP